MAKPLGHHVDGDTGRRPMPGCRGSSAHRQGGEGEASTSRPSRRGRENRREVHRAARSSGWTGTLRPWFPFPCRTASVGGHCGRRSRMSWRCWGLPRTVPAVSPVENTLPGHPGLHLPVVLSGVVSRVFPRSDRVTTWVVTLGSSVVAESGRSPGTPWGLFTGTQRLAQ